MRTQNPQVNTTQSSDQQSSQFSASEPTDHEELKQSEIQKQNYQNYQSSEEIQELLLQELENLFDRPCLIPVMPPQPIDPKVAQLPAPFKIGIEKDMSNTFLITNPQAIFRVFAKEQFLSLPESTQCTILDRLEDILVKCSHNNLILTDHIVQANPSSIKRICQLAINNLKYSKKNAKRRTSSIEGGNENKSPTGKKGSEQTLSGSPPIQRQHSQSMETDFLLSIIQLTLKLSTKKPTAAKKLIELVRRLTFGRRFFRCHIEYIYQYIKIKSAEKCMEGKNQLALVKVDTAIKLIQVMFDNRFEPGPTNFFYFSGFLSGIQVNTKQTNASQEFQKGFTAAMWLQIQENNLQDDKKLPVLFNCFFQGFGGFECYFNQRKLYYRILPKNYSHPNIESNGVLIFEFQPKTWYFFAIEHERPFMTRPQFTAIVNDQKVLTMPMDYPKIEKNAKLTSIVICQNFVGQLSSFMLFKDSVGNNKKLIQMGQQAYEYGIYSHQQLTTLKPDIFDQKFLDKLMLFYSPERTSNKSVYDCIEMRDGEMMINTGVCNMGSKFKLFYTGGFNSVLPILEILSGIVLLNKGSELKLDNILNEYLKLLIQLLSQRAAQISSDTDSHNFFQVFFFLLTKLPFSAVNTQTIQHLADIRFHIGEQAKLQEQFFQSLMMSSDFWINTDNNDVINEYWLFVKAIYQQNPVSFNKIFNIQNLIDLMVKISDIKDGHCCEFHRDTFNLFYQGIASPQLQPIKSENQWVLVDKSESTVTDKMVLSRPSFAPILSHPDQLSLNHNMPNASANPKIHYIDKYISPIAGVLEGVLTCGGNEVIDQIQGIAKALTVKSSPCFHLQMLKLLKVLLLDSKEDRHCATPADFAASFLKVKGLQILLYLCSNSSFDVKAMCLKLIDVLSSHTSLIKIAIDPDVITYLCSIILPKQLLDSASTLNRKSQQVFNKILNSEEAIITHQRVTDEDVNVPSQQQYMIMDDTEENPFSEPTAKQSDKDLEDSQEFQNQMNLLLAKPKPIFAKKREKLAIQENQADEEAVIMNSRQIRPSQDPREKFSTGSFMAQLEAEDPFQPCEAKVSDIFDEQVNYDEDPILTAKPPPPAPKNKGKLAIKFDFEDDEEEDDDEMEGNEMKFNQTQKNPLFGNKGKFRQIAIPDVYDEKQENEPDSDDINLMQPDKNKKQLFMNTQKIPTQGKKAAAGKIMMAKKGLQLQIEEEKRPTKVGNYLQSDQDQLVLPRNKKQVSKSNTNSQKVAKIDDQDQNQLLTFGSQPRKQRNAPSFGIIEDNNFANENVMSKSNLRQPKSFNFGFPDSDSEDNQEEEKVPQQKTIQNLESPNDPVEAQEDIEDFFAQSLPRKSPIRRQLGLNIETQEDTEQKQLDSLNLGGTTGATSDDFNQQDQVSETNEEQATIEQEQPIYQELEEEKSVNQTVVQLNNRPPKKTRGQAQISYKKNAKLFTNANASLNIDTEAINELFNYGGEQGQIMMTDDEEQKQFEADIEELASMCLAAMNRKKPTDPIKYEGKRTKTTFESKYLKEDEEEEKQDSQGNKSKKSKNPRNQFMTPQSVRGIKKIEFAMSQEEKTAALEGSKEGLNLSPSSLGSGENYNLSRGLGEKNGLLMTGTIMEEDEFSGNDNSDDRSSGNKQSTIDINFPGLLSASIGDELQKVNRDSIEKELMEEQKQEPTVDQIDIKRQNFTFAQMPMHFGAIQYHQDSDSKESGNALDDLINDNNQQDGTLQILASQVGQMTDSSGRINIKNDYFTQEFENLYTACLEWIISRAPSSLYENIVIDECDKIGYQPAIQLLMTLVTYSNNLIRQRALTDLEMLAKWDSSNGISIMMHPQFHTWLLELLMPYQDLAKKYSQLQGSSLAVYDIGCKLHTLLLKNICINPEEEAYKKINFLARWPLILQQQHLLGHQERQRFDIETAHKLSRDLMNSLVLTLRDEMFRQRPNIGKHSTLPSWQNFIYIASLIEESILCSNKHNIPRASDASQLGRDFNGQPLFKWIHDEDYLLYYNGSNDKALWAEWEILESLFLTIDLIYPDWTLKQLTNRQQSQSLSLDEQIYTLLEKSCQFDDFSNVVEILVHDMSPYKVNQTQYQQPATKTSKKGILGNVTGLAVHFKLAGNQSSSQQQQQSQETQAQLIMLQQSNEPSFMRTVLNMLCISLTQSDTKELVSLWLERFERFVKFIMIVSETWKSRMIATTYTTYQKKFFESITFAMDFLFNEIHATNRFSPTHQQSFNFNSTNQSLSPKEQLRFNKLYAQSLKNIMIYFINIIEYSKIKNTPSQFESHITACRYIFNNILVKSYSQGQYQESLISLKDISRFKQSDYEDFPECFYLDEWKVTFFNNEKIKIIVKKNLSLEMIQTLNKKRSDYASHYLETQVSNDKTKQDILTRMQMDTIEVIGFLSEEEFERKNKLALLNENFVRNQGYSWKMLKKFQIGGRGLWKSDPSRLKITWHRLGDGTRAIMEDCYGPSKFQYFKNVPGLEQRIFLDKRDNNAIDFLLIDETLHHQQFQDSEMKSKLSASPFEEEDFKLSDEDANYIVEEDEETKTESTQQTKTPQIIQRQSVLQQQNNRVVQYFSNMLSNRERVALKKKYVSIIKEFLYAQKANQTSTVKFKEIIGDMKCEILKAFYKKTGTITLTSHEIIFFEDLVSHSQNDNSNQPQENGDNIFFFKHLKNSSSLYYKIVPLQDLREIQRRRWLGRKCALELFLMNGKTLYLSFNTLEDREQFAKKVLRQRNQRCYNLKYYDTLEPRRILKKRELTERWMNWKISNFEYISLLNQLGGRSYNDLSQYPVYPWIIVDYQSSQPPDLVSNFNSPVGAPQGFRDLNKNMQLLGSAERQAEFKRKFDDMDSFETLQERFHCGTHYSNPGIVLHYMSRVSPYIDALIQLHGKSLDTPDRGFHSLHDSLQGALHDHADVRELIPEFFFCPEMFTNQNRINFGIKQDGVVVDDVQLPPWCQNDPYLFVIYMREAFESQYVSQNLNGWIDYIFGHKQRDQEAERSLNTFSRLTYEDGIDIDSIDDPVTKQGYQEQIYNYGQTPSQLFQKLQKHPSRLPKSQALRFNTVVDIMSKIKVYKPVNVQQQTNKGQQAVVQQTQQALISQEAILKAKFIDDSTIVGLSKDGNVTYFFWLSKAHELNPNTPFTCCEDKKKKFDNRTKYGGIDTYDRSIKRFDFPLLILHTHKCIFRGGFWGGKIQVCPIEGLSQDPTQSLTGHQTTVTAMAATNNEKIVISGTKSGDVIVWRFTGHTNEGSQWQIKKHLCDHESMVSFIHINEEMSMYITCSYDGTLNLYNFWNDKFIRQFQHPKLSAIHSGILTQTPLPALCFFSREDHYWYSYSLNNNSSMLEKQREESSHIISPLVIKDSHFMDRLVYGTEKGYIVFRSLPLLKQVKKQQVSTSYPVLSLIVSPERRFLLVGCGDGGLNVVTEPFSLQTFSSQQNIQSQQQTQSMQGSNLNSTMNTMQSARQSIQ